MTLTFWPSCLYFLRDGVTDIHHHTHSMEGWGWNPGLCACWASTLPSVLQPSFTVCFLKCLFSSVQCLWLKEPIYWLRSNINPNVLSLCTLNIWNVRSDYINAMGQLSSYYINKLRSDSYMVLASQWWNIQEERSCEISLHGFTEPLRPLVWQEDPYMETTV